MRRQIGVVVALGVLALGVAGPASGGVVVPEADEGLHPACFVFPPEWNQPPILSIPPPGHGWRYCD